jgi:hypothetical protein
MTAHGKVATSVNAASPGSKKSEMCDLFVLAIILMSLCLEGAWRRYRAQLGKDISTCIAKKTWQNSLVYCSLLQA